MDVFFLCWKFDCVIIKVPEGTFLMNILSSSMENSLWHWTKYYIRIVPNGTFQHNKISEEQTLWWNLYSVTVSLYTQNFNVKLRSTVTLPE